METWIAFFRGINVGGNNSLPMKALAALMEKQRCANVQTYIQSGNVVFRSAQTGRAFEKRLAAVIEEAHGFAPRIVLLNRTDLRRAVKENPFPTAVENHKSLHLFFLTAAAKQPDLDTLNRIKSATESFVLKRNVFYLHAPDGIGKSKLVARVDKCLGVETTARNWQTVTRVLAMAEEL